MLTDELTDEDVRECVDDMERMTATYFDDKTEDELIAYSCRLVRCKVGGELTEICALAAMAVVHEIARRREQKSAPELESLLADAGLTRQEIETAVPASHSERSDG